MSIKGGEEEGVAEQVNRARGTTKRKKAARTIESWAGLLLFGIAIKWNKEGGMRELK